MARRRSRRTRDSLDEDDGDARRSRRGRRGRKTEEVVEQVEIEDEEVEIEDEEELLSDSALEELVEDDSADTYESVSSSKSSRKMGRRSSRRSAASDREGKKSARRSNRRELTPEEKAAKRKAQLAFIKLVLGLVVVAGLVVGLLFVLKPDPARKQADAALEFAEADIKELDAMIGHGKLTEADELYGEIEEVLDDPSFVTFQDPAMMARIDGLKEALRDRGPRIAQAKADQAARRNFNALKARLDAITSADERTNPSIDLDQLQIDITDFRSNPVDPKNGAPMGEEEKDARYKTLIDQLAGAEGRIKAERSNRDDTKAVENEARIDIERLVTQRKYKSAYKALENYKAQHPSADFGGIEHGLDESVKQAWEGVRSRVEDAMETVNSDGASAKMKEENRKKAKDALQKVISDYNDTYVRRARDLMDEHDL